MNNRYSGNKRFNGNGNGNKTPNKYFLSETEKNGVLRRFPDFELSYEKMIYKKVSADMFVVIPKGKKYLAWFTYYKDKNVCILMEMRGRSLQFISAEVVSACFHSDLSFGTILYGTVTHYEDRRVFSVENVYYAEGKDCAKAVFSEKLKILKELFHNKIRQYGFTKNDIIFGLPIMKPTFQEAYDLAATVPYPVYSIQSRLVNRHANFLNFVYEETVKNTVFSVSADVQNDIYNLYYFKDGGLEFYDIAQIQDYKTSVLMNGLFRKIRENDNLDYLEESEDEDDFEDIREDKFVNLEKRVNMICVFNTKYHKWTPIRAVSQQDKIVTFSELQQLSGKNNSSGSNGNSGYRDKRNRETGRDNNNNKANSRYRHSGGNYPRARFANSGHASSRTRS